MVPVADKYAVYDSRLRPTRLTLTRRSHVRSGALGTRDAIPHVFYESYAWDSEDNLLSVTDHRSGSDYYGPEQAAREQVIDYDSLYRVAQVDFRYRRVAGNGAGTWGTSGAGTATDPRAAFDTQMADMQNARQVDPMLNASAGDASGPAPRVSPLPAERVNSLSYAYDWLGNQVHWSDDSGDFYERSIGTADTARRDILSGADVNEASGAPNNGTAARPAALYFASNTSFALGEPSSPRCARSEFELRLTPLSARLVATAPGTVSADFKPKREDSIRRQNTLNTANRATCCP